VAVREYQEGAWFAGKLKVTSRNVAGVVCAVPIPFTSAAFGALLRASQSRPPAMWWWCRPPDIRRSCSVIVKTGGRDYILAGDATYTEAQLLERRADGISPKP